AVARAAAWRAMGDLDQAAAALECALLLDPANWSLYLDLADVRAEQGDFAAAASLVERGLEYEPHEVSLRAARAAYRTRVSGSPDDLGALIALAPELVNTTYRNLLIDYACAGPKLPRRLVAKAHHIRKS
ncbi:tetratricopeptide repeat protein, partial [Streptomyces canus]|uniref:tetratricopeptide repeat protein n=1 Tax=Streptomyces canus TaxID=58343 RepID=UPI0022519D4D